MAFSTGWTNICFIDGAVLQKWHDCGKSTSEPGTADAGTRDVPHDPVRFKREIDGRIYPEPFIVMAVGLSIHALVCNIEAEVRGWDFIMVLKIKIAHTYTHSPV